MSEFGIKIKNYQAGSVYEVETGVRSNYDLKDAMLTNSLFSEFLIDHGLDVYKGESTRDIICLEFKYGSRSYEDELKHIKKIGRKDRLDRKLAKASRDKTRIKAAKERKKHINDLYMLTNAHKELYDKKSANEIRILFYKYGVNIRYPIFKKKQIVDYETIHYKMLYRTTGKAKKGSCMFIRDELYEEAHKFLWMGLELPYNNAPIVEIGAYSSLITSTIVGKVQIKPEEILILKDVDAEFITNVISIETNDAKECMAIHKDNYKLKNTLFDGQALIDDGVFPEWGDGYVLLRQHFFKAAAFRTYIQKFFKDYYGSDYETAEVTDMWGNKKLAKNIKLITTDNAIKWLNKWVG